MVNLIKWCDERHEYYCALASKFMSSIGKRFKHPTATYIAKPIRRAGQADYIANACQYNLVYAVGNEYEQTIAHEVAHLVVYQIHPYRPYYAAHGDMFKFVLEMILDRAPKKYHSYKYSDRDVALAQLILLKYEQTHEVRDDFIGKVAANE